MTDHNAISDKCPECGTGYVTLFDLDRGKCVGDFWCRTCRRLDDEIMLPKYGFALSAERARIQAEVIEEAFKSGCRPDQKCLDHDRCAGRPWRSISLYRIL